MGKTDIYSSKAMKEAVSDEWGDYLKKKPTRFEWENIQNAKMVVVKSREFYDAISKYEVDEHPIENALLIVEMIRQSFTADNSEQKNFFKCGEPYPFVVVFRHFREAAIQVLKQAARTGGTVDLQSTTAFHLLVSVLNLTLQCNVAIKTSKNYSQLKKRGLDWEEGIQKIHPVALLVKSDELNEAVTAVNEFLLPVTDLSAKTGKSPNEQKDTTENKNKRSVPEVSGMNKKAREDRDVKIPNIPKKSASTSNNGTVLKPASMDLSIPKKSNSGAKKGFSIKAFCKEDATAYPGKGTTPKANLNTIEASQVHAWTSQNTTHSYADFESSPWNQPGDSELCMSLMEPALPTKEEVRNMFFRNQ